MADFTLSEYQEKILDYFKNNPHSNILVNAYAGSGKSSTIKLLTETTKTSDVYLAFNNTVAEEFKQKITNPKTKVYTLHALAFLVMNNNVPSSSKKGGFGQRSSSSSGVKLDNLKPYKILDSIYPRKMGKIDFEYKMFLSSNFVSLYNLIRVTMTDIDDNEEILNIVREHNIFEDLSDNNFNPPPDRTILAILKEMNKLDWEQFEEDKVIDFTDMLYITYWKLKRKEWSVPYWLLFTNIYLDECLPGYVNIQCMEFDVDNRPHVTNYQLEKLWKRFESKAALPMALSYNEVTKRFEYRQITKVKKVGIRKTWGIRTTSLDGTTQDLRSTDNHPVLVKDKGFINMKDIKKGDWVMIGPGALGEEPQYEEVIKTFPGKVEKVYDITVDFNHNFVCRSDVHDHGFVTHNCQDQNNLQLNFIKFIKRDGGRYVAVGDFYQSCYNFNGANANAFNAIPKMFAPMEEFDLPICYRCATSHLERVNKTFNIPILPRPGAPKGTIKTINKADIIKFIKPGDMVISRKNKWLPDVIIQLVSSGVPVYMEDKEFVNAIKKLIDPKKFRTAVALQNYAEKIIQKTKVKSNKKDLNLNPDGQSEESSTVEKDSNQVDNYKFLYLICKFYTRKFPNSTIQSFANYVNKILSTDLTPDVVRVTSVHKAKGLEADNVFVLNEGKVCFNPNNSKEQNMQERNLSYISITRAKQNLYLVREEV